MTRLRCAVVAGSVLLAAVVHVMVSPAVTAGRVQAGRPRFTTPPGFAVERVNPAGKTDSYVVITFDSLGRLMVSKEQEPPRWLLDTDGDGILETEKIFSDEIVNCQGLWWDDRTLYAVGTGKGGEGLTGTGLYRLRDTNADDVADTFDRVTAITGNMGDHGPHAVRRGPDGTLRLQVGNFSPVPPEMLDPGSPLRRLDEGQLLESWFDPRGHAAGILAPGSQVYRYDADRKTFSSLFAGMRNAYDHAYNLAGEAFTFDSDMEWDVNLPWYKDVRTVHGVTGGDFGWRSGSRNLPAYYLETLPPVRDLGRGSPVGVETYQHYAYPRQYFDMLLEADWSRGRLLYTELTADGATYRARDDRAEFVHGEPLNITDLEVGPDGHVYFSLGGRGTEGGVYRIRYTGAPPPAPDRTGILSVVRQPQPLSSWGWASIEAVKARLGGAFGFELEQLARDASADVLDRARALYEMQRHGAPPRPDVLAALARDRETAVRAAVVYIAGLQGESRKALAIAALRDGDPFVRRRALEALIVMGMEPEKAGFAPVDDIYGLLNDSDRFVRFAARLALERTPRHEWKDRVVADSSLLAGIEGMVAYIRTATSDEELAPLFRKQLELMRRANLSVEHRLRLVRAFQLAAIKSSGVSPEMRAQVHHALAPQFPAADERLSRELALTLAYAGQPAAIGEILDAMPPGDQNPALQIHYLYALRAIREGWTADQRARLLDWFPKAVKWRGGASFAGYINLLFDASLPVFTDEERQLAYQRVPEFAPLSADEIAAAGRGRQGGGPPGAPAPGAARGTARAPAVAAVARASALPPLAKQEMFEDLVFNPGRGPGRGGQQQTDPIAAGRDVFEKACASCHRFGSAGADAGPELSETLARLSKRDFVEGMFFPSKAIDARYRSTSLELADGPSLTGLVVAEDAQKIVLKIADAAPTEVPKARVKARRTVNESIMPETAIDRFSLNDLRNLLAFLGSTPPRGTQ
jgi:putative heme-binding domain-containing protein